MDPSARIDQKIASLTDWRGKTLAAIRQAIHDADPEVVEEWKYMGSPCWYHDGLLCVANAHKDAVNVVFLHGAKLPDPRKVFNHELGGTMRRGVKFLEGDKINGPALKAIVRAAIDFNLAKSKAKQPARRRSIR